MDYLQNKQINSTNVTSPTNIDQMINNSTTLGDDEVEWIEVTDDEVEEQEKQQKVGEIEKQEVFKG